MSASWPSCSVVICTRYRAQTLQTCLQAVSRLDYPDFELLVVDNTVGDPSTQEVAERHRAKWLVEPTAGLSRARNRGSLASGKEIVAFLDDDALPEPGWLSALAAQFQDPRVMAVAGRTLTRAVSSNGSRPSLNGDFLDLGGKEQRVVDLSTAFWFQCANFGGIGNGMNMAFRRQAWEIWPGFDERLGLGSAIEGCEEHYSFFSLIDRGYRVVYTPDAVVRHPSPHRTLREVRSRFLKECVASGAYMTFLFWEEPRYRKDVLRFVSESLLGVRRDWRSGKRVPWKIVPAWRVLLARCAGPFVYLRSRIGGNHR
jgi:cellulose synthase/poly-beta-1,6-N-acetylglucosamine synthase-like glycosyltransferase